VPPFKEEFERRFGLRITTGYGLTDGGMAVWADAAEDLPDGACGKARDPYHLLIVDGDGSELPTGESGEILLTSRTAGAMMDGYLSMPEETSRVLTDGWLHTGDLGHLDGEGFLYFDGRKSDSIRRRGENISAWEVEFVLESHPSVLEAAVIGVPSDLTEEDVKAFVVLRAGHRLEADELREYCHPRMAKYMVPDQVEFLDEIPRTPTGKTAKHLLRT
jgi:crotonobetaine/carnitine-CoA ligase